MPSDNQSKASEHPTTYDECLNQLETLHWKYDLPNDFDTRLSDIIDLADNASREETAERVGNLIGYLLTRHPEYEYNDQIQQYLNGVMTSLYGND